MQFLSKQLKILRLRADLTQKQLARKTGLSQSTIFRIEIDCSNTQFRHIFTVLNFLIKLTNDKKAFNVVNDNKVVENYFLLFLGLKHTLFYQENNYNPQEIQLITVCLDLIDQINLILLNKVLK